MGWLWGRLKDLWEWHAEAVKWLFEWFTNNVIFPVTAWFGDIWLNFVNWIKLQVPEWLRSLVELARSLGIDVDPDQTIEAIEGVWAFVVELNWIIPIGAMLGIWLTAFTACMIIRIARTVKSFVPTMGD